MFRSIAASLAAISTKESSRSKTCQHQVPLPLDAPQPIEPTRKGKTLYERAADCAMSGLLDTPDRLEVATLRPIEHFSVEHGLLPDYTLFTSERSEALKLFKYTQKLIDCVGTYSFAENEELLQSTTNRFLLNLVAAKLKLSNTISLLTSAADNAIAEAQNVFDSVCLSPVTLKELLDVASVLWGLAIASSDPEVTPVHRSLLLEQHSMDPASSYIADLETFTDEYNMIDKFLKKLASMDDKTKNRVRGIFQKHH